jgi:hypothetical protein
MRMNNFFAIALVTLMLRHRGAGASTASPSPPGTVTLPVADYDRLIDRAAQPDKPLTPPVAAVVTRADLRARGRRPRAARCVWTVKPSSGDTSRLLSSPAQRFSKRVPRASAAPAQQGDAHAAADRAVSLLGHARLGLPLTAAPGRARSLPCPPAAWRATIDLPGIRGDTRGAGIDHAAADGIRSHDTRRDARARKAHTGPWSVRETTPEPVAVETRILAEVKSLVTIGDADLRLVALIDVTVVRQGAGPSTVAFRRVSRSRRSPARRWRRVPRGMAR